MMLLPVSYNLGWTAKLLRRDLRVLRMKLTTRLKLKSKPGEAAKDTSEPKNLHYVNRLPMDVSEATAYSSPQGDVLDDEPETDSEKCNDTLYELLEGRLRATYASRNRDVSHQDRWRFRGSWLLLYKAIQTCASNDGCDILRACAHDTNEKRLLLETVQSNTNRNRLPFHEVSKMPAAPYTKHDSDHSRYDSMLSNATTLTPTPSPAQIWLSILEATNDAERIAPMAQELLQYTWSGKEAVDIIEQIGDPHKKFPDADDAELRVKFRQLLCSELMLSTPCR